MRNKNTSQLKRYYLLIKIQRKIELDLLIIYLEMNQKKEKTTDEHEEKQVLNLYLNINQELIEGVILNISSRKEIFEEIKSIKDFEGRTIRKK